MFFGRLFLPTRGGDFFHGEGADLRCSLSFAFDGPL